MSANNQHAQGNIGYNPRLDKHEERISATEKEVRRLNNKVFGPDDDPQYGLNERVKKLEDGASKSLVKGINWIAVFIGISALTGVVKVVYDIFTK